MSASFLPLAPKAHAPVSDPKETKVTLLPQGQAQFRPLAAAPAQAAPAAPPPDHSHPKVTLKKEADRIVGFQVHCSCGQILEFACTY